MDEMASGQRSSIWQLILVPAVITLAVTILRLVGELHHWSKVWFNPEAGGPWSIVGIAWLAPIFGIYFAVKLTTAREGPRSGWGAIALGLLGVALAVAVQYSAGLLFARLGFLGIVVLVWCVYVVAAFLQHPAWPRMFAVLTAYAFAARLPVVIVMFLAFRGNWGTHYDALPPVPLPAWGFWQKFVWLGLIPQLTFWVGYTIVFGALFAAITAALLRLRRKPPHPVS
jgi:hypothetical protein